VGESGSGKSVTALSTVSLLPGSAEVTGSVRYLGREMVGAEEDLLRAIRGNDISFIFQEPMTSLNPLHTLEKQITESLTLHQGLKGDAARTRVIELLTKVGIRDPESRLGAYPHQLSGGQRQRVMIAMALANGPELLIADEPTTALDVTIQAQILFEIQKLVAENNTAMIWVTHDLAVVAGLADRVAVMYAGRIVEMGTTDEVVNRPFHPYTSGLIGSAPSRNARGTRLTQIRGMAPLPMNLPTGCAFRPRCDLATEACATAPEATTPDGGHLVRCHHPLAGGFDRGTAA
jgi:peptide/nickel transport system ATP-binding protein